jgi:NADH-quinone oxidoreductase subunit N
MTLLGFLVMIIVANHSAGDDIIHFSGLNRRSPFLAFAMLMSMLSLAGIPLTVGFLGKFYVFAAAMEQHHYGLVAIGVVTVAAGFYYYLKVVRAMYWLEPTDTTPIPVGPVNKIVISALCAAIVILGVYPGPVVNALHPQPAPQVALAH